MDTTTKKQTSATATASSTPTNPSALLNTISPPFPLGSTASFSSSGSPASVSELLDLARKTPLPPSNQSSPLKHPSKFSATNSLRATWSSRLSVSDHLVAAAPDSGHSRSQSTSPPALSRQVQFRIQDDSSHIPAQKADPVKLASSSSTMPSVSTLPSGLNVLNTTQSGSSATNTATKITTNGISSSPTRSSSSTSPATRGRIVHRSLSPTSRTQQTTKSSARSPIRPLSKARVPKGSPALLVRVFDAFTQSMLFVLGLAFLAAEFIYAQVRSVLAVASTQQVPRTNTRSSRSPRRNLQAKLDGVALWPPIGLGWFAKALHVLEAKCGSLIGRAMFAVLVLAVGPSYVGMVVGVSVPLAMVKALSQRGTSARRHVGLAAGADAGRGRKVSRS